MTTTDKTSSPGDGLGHRLQDASDRFIGIKDDVANRVGKRIDSLRALMTAHPLAALGVGLGIGYLIARMRRR